MFFDFIKLLTQMNEEYKYKGITEKIIGVAYTVHEVQLLNYLKAAGLEIGLLINFGYSALNKKIFILKRRYIIIRELRDSLNLRPNKKTCF